MLDLESVDLGLVVLAFEDHSYDQSSWLDPATGKVKFCSIDDDEEDFEERGLLYIDPGDSRRPYQDMVDFAGLVSDARTREMLSNALRGRGAFRRFKDTLYQSTDLGREWSSFHDLRVERRAIEWLQEAKVISDESAHRALAQLPEPESIGPPAVGDVADVGPQNVPESAVSPMEKRMDRWVEEIGAARILAREGFAPQAVSRSYYAAFYAAEAALLSLGQSRSEHAAVVSAFERVVVEEQGVDERAGRLLRSLHDRRSDADSNVGPVPGTEADQAIEDAETVVEIVSTWLDRRSS